jgi:hypothetical protein
MAFMDWHHVPSAQWGAMQRRVITGLLLVCLLGAMQNARADSEEHLLPELSKEFTGPTDFLRNRMGRSNSDTCDDYNRSSIEDQMGWLDRGCRCLSREEADLLTPTRESLAQACIINALQHCEGRNNIWAIKARCYKQAIQSSF